MSSKFLKEADGLMGQLAGGLKNMGQRLGNVAGAPLRAMPRLRQAAAPAAPQITRPPQPGMQLGGRPIQGPAVPPNWSAPLLSQTYAGQGGSGPQRPHQLVAEEYGHPQAPETNMSVDILRSAGPPGSQQLPPGNPMAAFSSAGSAGLMLPLMQDHLRQGGQVADFH